MKYIQIPSYNYCYRKNINLYDWIAFFDFDEYLFIHNNHSIKNYLSNNNFSQCQSILFNWYEYSDNDLLKYDNRTLIQRFTSLIKITNMTKFIARGNLSDIIITLSHLPSNINYCNSKGELYKPKSFKIYPKENNSFAYIRHYQTKTAQEYCNKILRGDVQFGTFIKKKIYLKIKRFFSLNKQTPIKIKIFEKCFNITNISNYLKIR